jgi:mannose-6-phosphate isomerase-like protein (cupin superfamily)
MNVQKVVNELTKLYPGKNIVINTPEAPTEIICEIQPGSFHPDKSVAVAVLDSNLKHYHRHAKEVYEVLKGNLKISKAEKMYLLKPGDKIQIDPGEYHMAEGHETWVRVTSTPAWTPEDQLASYNK